MSGEDFTESRRAHTQQLLPTLDYWKSHGLGGNGQFEEFKSSL